jgi:peroxiredoxin/mono/diheme cytochrome c family protein
MSFAWVSSCFLYTLLGQPAPAPIGITIPDFQLPDSQGRVRRLSDWHDRQLVVVVFLSVECPLAKLYAGRLANLAREWEPRRVIFLGIDANRQDALADLGRYAQVHQIPFPLLRDADASVADLFQATRTPEAFVLDERRRIRYRGRIDDQYTVNGRRAQPSRRDLAVALAELLAGEPVGQPLTPVTGCWIDRPGAASRSGKVTYARDIAPLIQQHCLGCHRPGQVAPFSLTTYLKTVRWAETIREVVREGRMPPWHANPNYGRFANDPSLTERERQLIETWVQNGTPEGDPADLPPPPAFADTWSIPNPDQIVSLPRPVTVPADGVMEYQIIEVDPGFREDKWIQAAEILPSNRRVVHHCIVYLKHPESDQPTEQGALGSFCLTATTPGTPPLLLPAGMAKKVPAGWTFVFVVHYQPIGSVQTDQTRLGLVFADPRTVQKEVATKLLYADDFAIPPRTPDFRVERTHLFSQDVLLLAMLPHMHLRGKSFRYEAVYPDGRTEILLDVPRYDFSWQHRYVLAEPKRLPAGTTLRCTAHYDNSAANPVNPNPDVTVRAGVQSWDEMFNGYFEWALADQDLTQSPPLGRALRPAILPVAGLALVAIYGGALLLRRRQGRSAR